MTFYCVPYGFILHAGPYTLALILNPRIWRVYVGHDYEHGLYLDLGPIGWHYHSGRMPF